MAKTKQQILNEIYSSTDPLDETVARAAGDLQDNISAIAGEIVIPAPNDSQPIIKPATSGAQTPIVRADNNALTILNNQEIAVYMRADRDYTIDAIIARCIGSANAGQNAAVAIFLCDEETGLPGIKLAQGTSINLSTDFNGGILELPISYTLEKNKPYYIVLASNGGSRSYRSFPAFTPGTILAAGTSGVANSTFNCLKRTVSANISNIDAWTYNTTQLSTDTAAYLCIQIA